MDCRQCNEWMDQALDRQLDEQQTAFSEHLAHCDACRREYEELSAMVQAIRDLPDMEVPEGFRQSWKATLFGKDGGGGSGSLFGKRSIQMLIGVAAAVFLAFNLPLGGLRMAMDEAPQEEEAAMEAPADPAPIERNVERPQEPEAEEPAFGILATEPDAATDELTCKDVTVMSVPEPGLVLFCLDADRSPDVLARLAELGLAYSSEQNESGELETVRFTLPAGQYGEFERFLLDSGAEPMTQREDGGDPEEIEVELIFGRTPGN